MDDVEDDHRRRQAGLRQVARLLLPVYAASSVVILIGVVLALAHHRTLGLVFVVVGALGGFAARARLMLRNQQGPRSRP